VFYSTLPLPRTAPERHRLLWAALGAMPDRSPCIPGTAGLLHGDGASAQVSRAYLKSMPGRELSRFKMNTKLEPGKRFIPAADFHGIHTSSAVRRYERRGEGLC